MLHSLLRLAPKNHLSCLLGGLAGLHLPFGLGGLSVRSFARAYGIDMSEAEMGLCQYRSIAELFTRRLKPGVRPIGEGPVDGTLRGLGPVQSGRIEQVKGMTYALTDLLGGSSYASRFLNGWYFNLYLSPKDYHHVHAPVGGEVVACSCIPGKLWPVNDWSLRRIQNLFSINERIVTYISGAYGVVAVVMVGATNVGKISVEYDDLATNRLGLAPWRKRAARHLRYDAPSRIDAGQRLGTFHLGSTVIMLCERDALAPSGLQFPEGPAEVKYGRSLARLSK
jgi:phosphatidylserine decarboxylase